MSMILSLLLLLSMQAGKPSGCLPMLVFVNSKSGDNQVSFCKQIYSIYSVFLSHDLCGITSFNVLIGM